VFRLGKVYGQRPQERRTSTSLRSYLCRDLQLIHRTHFLQSYGLLSTFIVPQDDADQTSKIFSLIFIFAFILISNIAFGFFRNKMHQDAFTHYPPPPPTPQRHPSNGLQFGPYTPYHHGSFPPLHSPWQQPMGLEPVPSDVVAGTQSPSKRLEYHG